MKSLKEVKERVRNCERKTIAVAAAADFPVLEAVKDAVEQKLADAILIGNADEIRGMMKKLVFAEDHVEIIDVREERKAAATAVEAVRNGKAQVLMKGMIGTSDFMRAVLNKEQGLRTGRELTHVSILDSPKMRRLIIMTDPAMHMYPNLEEKIKILKAAEEVSEVLEIENPKAAVVCAVEVVNPAMQATVDAALLAKMSERGQLGKLTVEGPLGLDNALDAEAARHKGIAGKVAGNADILLMPNIESGNIMWKTLVYMSDAEPAGIIVGAAAPIVLTSRSDSPSTKLNSIALALLAGRKAGEK